MSATLCIPEIPHASQYERPSFTAPATERQQSHFKPFRVAGVTLTRITRDAIIDGFTTASQTWEMNPLRRIQRALGVPAALIWWVIGKHFEACEAARRAALAAYDEVWADASTEAGR